MNAFDSKLLDGKTKLHFVGIGGSGMFPLVQILHEVGYEITGSDVNEGDIIDRERKLGIPISMGHKAENVHGAELVVYTAAIMKGNPEIEEAHRLGIPTVERSILLGYVANTYPHPISIAGTHGKTTTTAMTTQIMVMAHADPAAVIGGKLPLIDAYGRYGTGREIVVEACEYSNTFLHLVPYISVLLNVDADHLEFFKTMENLGGIAAANSHCSPRTPSLPTWTSANTVKVIHNLDRHIRTAPSASTRPRITAPCMCANTAHRSSASTCRYWVCPQCTLNFRCPDATMCTMRWPLSHAPRCPAARPTSAPGASTHSGAPAAALSFWER